MSIYMRAKFTLKTYCPEVVDKMLQNGEASFKLSYNFVCELMKYIFEGSLENSLTALTTFDSKFNEYLNNIDSKSNFKSHFEKFEEYLRTARASDETGPEYFYETPYEKFLLRNFLEANCKDILNAISVLYSIFKIQNKIYAFISVQDAKYLPDQYEIETALRKKNKASILGLEGIWRNPFYKDNIKLIALIYLLIENSSSEELNSEVQLASEQGRQIDLAFLKCCQGKLKIKNGLVPEGLKTLLEGIKLYEGIRYSVSTDQLGVGFGSSYLEYYGWIIDALLQLGYPRLAFDGVERSTARALLDLVSRRTYRSCSLEGVAPTTKLIGEIQDLDFNIYFSQSETYQDPFFAKFLSEAVKHKLSNDFYQNKAERLNRLKKQRDSLIGKLDPESAALVELNPLSWGTFSERRENVIPFEALWNSQAISEKEAILSFHVIHKLSFAAKEKPWDKIFCFALYQERGILRWHHHIVDDSQTVAELQQKCQGIVNEINNKKRLPSLSHISDNLLIPLLRDLPNDCNCLTISANSDLQFFPWSALYYNDEYSANKRLVDKFKIKTTPSLSLLYLLKLRENPRPATPTKFLIAGIQNYPPPQAFLFWSGIEVERISQLYPSASVRQLKDESVDQHFANEFRKAEVIHYSGHANYDHKPDSQQDALEKTYLCLYKQEISAAQILDGALENPNAKVMILSACLTGTGDLTTSGSEILGLERALFHAGLSSLITTLWKVPEFSTALLMVKLHSLWRLHNNTVDTLASSLRDAQPGQAHLKCY
ncbi:CHAT domain-containing protein [Funiculus sociatus GB2-A5]|uniref:CHAT domain-containing protein n=1 Tax=Funiculus sociatus GB2-A5 TaxID=2933946 RepID=A0ABV0JXU1_9CYAN|nr:MULTISPECIES: CHAT domain-containing protein [unclassified Trichocoleus]MBD1903963.1 CHAT domain-containing protein [Trichocoleus sp. FACHB-832]MBD2061844.1 CHAT domain-containing protein [Trichocoleus sp. FACHB-6]